MDWRRITNRRRKRADRTEREEAGTKDSLEQYLHRLLPELNLRLLLETEDSCHSVLWVESVSVTAYQFVSAQRSSGKPKSSIAAATGDMGIASKHDSPAGRMLYRLMGIFGSGRALKKK